MGKIIKAVIKKPGENPYKEFIDDSLSSLQSIVGGDIEAVSFQDFCFFCNEEGKLLGLTPNFFQGNDIIVGTVVFVGTNDDDGSITDLTDKQIDFIMNKYVGIRPKRYSTHNPNRRRERRF